MQMPRIMNQANGNDYINSFFNGAMVKFNDNQFSYRITGTYLKKSAQFFNNCDNCEITKGDLNDYSFKVGFEKNINYSTFQPYLAFDLGYRSNEFRGNSTQPDKSVMAIKQGLTLSPVFGLKINPIPQISIFAESNLELFYAYGRNETVTQGASKTTTLEKFRKGEFLLNPVTVGIQIHLDSKN